LVPNSGFPKEVALTTGERDSLKWAQEALEAVRKGEVAGLVLIGGGKFYLELSPGRTETEIRVQEPLLQEPAVEEPESEGDVGHEE